MVRIIEIKDLVRKESPVLYRKEYFGSAVFETVDNKQIASKINFILESTSSGHKSIKVNFIDEINYPLLTAIKRVKEHIVQLESLGKLR